MVGSENCSASALAPVISASTDWVKSAITSHPLPWISQTQPTRWRSRLSITSVVSQVAAISAVIAA